MQMEHAVLPQILPTSNPFGLKIFNQFGPVTMVGFLQQLHQPPSLATGGGLLKSPLEQCGIPPSDLIVAGVAKPTWLLAPPPELRARHLVHPPDDLRIPHVQPRSAGRGPDV